MSAFATPEGTKRYTNRFVGRAALGHFREQPGTGLWMSSIGIGTYLGSHDARTDQAYSDAIVCAVTSGVSVIDSAINYRCQRSERSVGAALAKLAAAGYTRDELILCTKGGYLTPDGDMPANPAEYFFREYIERGIIRVDDIAAGSHCMAPRYLENQLQRSLHNLGVECIDIYYLHNPETQFSSVSRQEFHRRLRAAFEFLESAVAAGRVRMYGLATWNAFRQAEDAPDYLSLREILTLAREVAGERHHFRVVQLPYNLAMSEALTLYNQALDGRRLPMVEAAHALGITLVASASLLQGQLTRNLPAWLAEVLGLESDLHRALQFVRSSPGITTALVGMSRIAHVQANLKLVAVEPTPPGQFVKLFQEKN
jgi:aryl-alcohol dehydrogenase-like predicted oxidoreductase